MPLYALLLAAAFNPVAAQAQPTKTWDGYAEVTEGEQLFVSILNLRRAQPDSFPDLSVYLYRQFHRDARSIRNEEDAQQAREFMDGYQPRPPLVYLKEAEAEAFRRLPEVIANLPKDPFPRYNEEVESSPALSYPHLFDTSYVEGPSFDTVFDSDIHLGRAASLPISTRTRPVGRYLYDRTPTTEYRSPTAVTSYVASAWDKPEGDVYIYNSIYVEADKYPDRPYEDTIWLTGTVYRDGNGNGRYDPGEQVPNVAVTPNRGEYKAVSAASGGYAIPFQHSDAGPVRVVARDETGWERIYELELPSFSERSGDGGLWHDIKLPPNHAPAVYDLIESYGWTAPGAPYEIKFTIDGYDQRKRLLFAARVGERDLEYQESIYDSNGMLRSDADPFIKIYDSDGNLLGENEHYIDVNTGLGATDTNILRFVRGYALHDWELRSAAIALWLKPGTYTFVIEANPADWAGPGPVLAQIYETEFDVVDGEYVMTDPSTRTVRVSEYKVIDKSPEGFPRHIAGHTAGDAPARFKAYLGLGPNTLKIEGWSQDVLRIAPVKGAPLKLAAEFRFEAGEYEYSMTRQDPDMPDSDGTITITLY